MLERRPDVAAAERIVAARNADIGVAKAAYFPAVRLTGTGGYLSKEVDTLLTGNSKVWSIGPSVSLPLTGWAVIHFNVKRTDRRPRRSHRQLPAGRPQRHPRCGDQSHPNPLSRRAGQRCRRCPHRRHQGHRPHPRLLRARAISYLELLDAERTRLQAELQTARIAAQRHIATVRLIKALGGGW
jgi:multidrug efflux system outer membrane protein